MRHYRFGRGKWVFIDWMGINAGYGTAWGGASSEGWCVPEGIAIKVHPPSVDPSMVIRPDQPWEGNHIGAYCTFLDDGGTLRCWYEIQGGGLGYAESDDGVTWRKPRLGHVERNGSTENNIVPISGLAKNPFDEAGVPHGHGIFIDPVAADSERYKMVSCFWTATERKVLGAVSPDGLQWTALPQPLMEEQHADTQNIAAYDEQLGKYVLYTRQSGRLMRRGVNRTVSSDFRHFPDSEPVLMGESNPLDPPDADIYCNGYSRWPGATDAHLMRLSMYEHTPDTMNVHLATSRDGVFWHRPLIRTPWIDCVEGPEGLFQTVYACAGVVPTAPGEWSTYASIRKRLHNQPKADEATSPSGIVRATLREDGFTSLSSRGRGTFWTVPFELESDVISVNVRTLYSGFLRCQILSSGAGDTGGATRAIEDIEGYTLDDSQAISGDHIDAPLNWNGKTDVSHLRGQTVRLRFDLYKADLYAIRF